MKYNKLGKSGLEVSELSFGSWVTFGNQIDDQTAENLMITAYDNGVNFFDNAEAYAGGRSEEVMGNILTKLNWPRESYVVSSKVFWGGDGPNRKGLNRKHVVEACHAALRRLQVEYLDLYFCHRPDIHTPIAETVWTMHNLIQQGKILYWGTSEWSAQQITEAHAAASQHHLLAPVVEQPEYHMFHRHRFEVEYKPLYENFGMGTTTWSPLNSGVLTGKYLKDDPGKTRVGLPGLEWLKDSILGDNAEDKLNKVRKLNTLADGLSVTLPVLAVAWVLNNPRVSTCILGASQVEQLEENLNAADAVTLLTPDVLDRIEGILDNKPSETVW